MSAATGTWTVTGPAPADGAVRDTGVDGLRGLAALAVLAYHVATTPGGPISPWISPLGDAAVAVFFGVSGYLLWRPVVRAVLGDRPTPGAGAFLLRRAGRILPAYWLAITVGFWLLDSGRPRTASDAIAQYTLTHIYRRGDAGAGLFVAWTLAVEVAFSLLVAALAAVLAATVRTGTVRRRTQVLLGIIALLVVIAFASRQVILHGPATGGWRLQWPPNLVDWFAVGMLLAVVRVRGELGHPLPNWLRFALRVPALWWLVGLELYWVMTRLAARPTVTPNLVQGIYGLTALFVLALLAPVVLGNPHHEPTATLRRQPLAFGGLVSYGIYLWHAVWLRVVNRWSASGAIPAAYLPRLGVTLALTLPCAWLSWTFVERPCIAWARDLSRNSGRAAGGTD